VGRAAADLRSKGVRCALRRIGNYKFENFEVIPLSTCTSGRGEPKIINDWPFSGWDGGTWPTFLISGVSREAL